jgi:two-component system aerobic respiration control sensor histidine kinase ArcB
MADEDRRAVRVLYVDGDPERRGETADRLEDERGGFVVETATDRDAALDSLAGQQHDCLVSAHAPPDTDGLELLVAVRDRYRDLPVALFPTDGDEGVASEAIAAGVTEYVPRDGSADAYAVLADRLEAAVERSRSERETEGDHEMAASMFDALMENVPVGIYFKNAAGEHVRVSDYQCRQYGDRGLRTPAGRRLAEPADFIGKTDLNIYAEELAEASYADDMHVIETGEPILGKQEHHPTPDDGDRWVSTTKVPWYDDGECRGLMGITLDITEQVRTRRKLEQQNEYLEEFAGLVSHDLRNPLNTAQGHLQATDYDDDHIDRASERLEHMAGIVDDLLALARHGRTVTDPEPVAVESVAVERWWRVAGGGADSTLALEDPGVVLGDERKLGQLFENLFRNSLGHGDPPLTVTVGALDGGFYVADDGNGFDGDPDDFFEAGHSTDEAGTGLGLTIVEAIAEAHGWRVTATTGVDGGARFEFRGVERPSER